MNALTFVSGILIVCKVRPFIKITINIEYLTPSVAATISLFIISTKIMALFPFNYNIFQVKALHSS